MRQIEDIIENSQHLAESLLKKQPASSRNFPDTQGVYLIYNTNGNIIYIGKAKKLHRRINDDHISGERKMSTGTFRRKLHKVYEVKPGKEIRGWVIKNCLFAYEEIENPDICTLVEALLIVFLRAKGEPLLND